MTQINPHLLRKAFNFFQFSLKADKGKFGAFLNAKPLQFNNRDEDKPFSYEYKNGSPSVNGALQVTHLSDNQSIIQTKAEKWQVNTHTHRNLPS